MLHENISEVINSLYEFIIINMNELRVKYKISTQKIPLAVALEKGYVVIQAEKIMCVEGSLVCATGIFDKNNREIYIDDLLVDNNGNKYQVVALRSSVLLKSLKDDKSMLLGNFSQYSFNSRVDFEILNC